VKHASTLTFALLLAGCGSAASTETSFIGAGGESSSSTDVGGAGGAGGGSTTTDSTLTSTASSTGGTGGTGPAMCAPIPACNTAPPAAGPAEPWNHSIASPIIVASGGPNHRGRDLFLNPGDPQWIIAKFAYGLIDKDLKDEKVDIYLLRDCGSSWEKLGSTMTTNEGVHATVEGVDDSGGRVYFQIPDSQKLGLGRHRVHLVVKGDLSSTELFIEVVEEGTPMFVSDVDGTLTDNETAEFPALLTGTLPGAHTDAAKAFRVLAAKGYRPMYLTARPEWLVGRTREFLDANGFPPGIVHTTVGLTGATGAPAGVFKTDEMAMLAGKGLVPSWAFGNTASDADAYENGMILPVDHRVFYQFDDTVHGGRRIDSYTQLLDEFGMLPNVCK
jgi:hypothetical protein